MGTSDLSTAYWNANLRTSILAATPTSDIRTDGASLLDSLLVLADLDEDVYSDSQDAEASRLMPLVIRGLAFTSGSASMRYDSCEL